MSTLMCDVMVICVMVMIFVIAWVGMWFDIVIYRCFIIWVNKVCYFINYTN